MLDGQNRCWRQRAGHMTASLRAGRQRGAKVRSCLELPRALFSPPPPSGQSERSQRLSPDPHDIAFTP